MSRTVAVGIAMLIASIWGGSYAMSILYDTWAGFPTLITALILFIAGIGITAAGLHP